MCQFPSEHFFVQQICYELFDVVTLRDTLCMSMIFVPVSLTPRILCTLRYNNEIGNSTSLISMLVRPVRFLGFYFARSRF